MLQYNNINISNLPIADQIDYGVKFGNIIGENRGDNPMNKIIIKNDPYYWLRDDDRKDPKVLDYITRENEYIQKKLYNSTDNKKILNELQNNIKSRINEDYESIKTTIGDINKEYIYNIYWRNVKGFSHKLHYIETIHKITCEKKEYLLLDENKLKDTNKRCDIENLQISYNHKYLIYGLDIKGDEQYNLFIFDINNLNNYKQLSHNIPSILYGNYIIDKSCKYIFYSQSTSNNRINQLYVYNILSKKSKKLWEDMDSLNTVNFWLSMDKEILFIEIENYSNNTIYYINMNYFNFEEINDINIYSEIKIIQKGLNNDKYKIEKINNYFIILTNKLGNINYIPMYCNIGEYTGEENWRFINKNKLEIKLDIKENDIIYYDDILTLEKYLVFLIRHNGVPKIIFTEFNNNLYYPFNDDWNIISPYNSTGILYFGNNNIHNATKLNIIYTSFTIPKVFISCDLKLLQIDTKKKDIIPNYDEDKYISKRIYALTYTGIKIPISIVYKNDIDIANGPHKLHLYAYGSYGHIVDSKFNRDIITLLDKGYIYAIAHVRGGGFMGDKWYEDGKMLNKMNTFGDIECVAKYLISIKYTSPKLMSFEGRSAGGLLAGYCLVKLSNLFNSIIAEVPFVDALTTMSDSNIPLTTSEWKQWGNPNEETYYNYMSLYSPYDNIIENTNFSHFFITGGLYDPRVQYWEPTKFVAKLRKNHKSIKEKLQFLEIKMNDGHFNSNDRYKNIEEVSKKYLFLLNTII